MASISGVKINKSAAGKTTHVTIDVRRHPQTIDLLKNAGLMPKTPLETEAEDCLTVDEVFDRLEAKIKEHYANGRNQTLR